MSIAPVLIQAVMTLCPSATAWPRDFELDDTGAITAWNVEAPQPTPAAIATQVQALVAAEAAQKADASALRTGILAQANTAVGVTYASVTAPMVKALVWILLWRIGALNKDLTVRPLADWVKDQ